MERLSGRAMEFLGTALSGVLQSGLALLNLVVADLRHPGRGLLPVARLGPHGGQAARHGPARRAADRRIAWPGRWTGRSPARIRGQGLVCLFLAAFYSAGLWLVGLNYGLIIGLLTGLFSFIPYIGMAVGLLRRHAWWPRSSSRTCG